MTGEDLIEQFERGATPADGFHHVDHVWLAFEFLSRYSTLEELGRDRRGRVALATAGGRDLVRAKKPLPLRTLRLPEDFL